MKQSLLIGMVVLAFLALPLHAAAQPAEGEGVEISRTTALIGEQFRMTVRVLAPAGATVELTPGTESWGEVELVRYDPPRTFEQGAQTLWVFEATVAGFSLGPTTFAPSVAITSGAEIEARTLPQAHFVVGSVLPPDGPLRLRDLAAPVAIAGAESPWLRPAIAAGIIVGTLLLLGIGWLIVRRLARALRRPAPPPGAEPEMPLGLEGAADALSTDPVAAYRLMSAVVKRELAARYGLRATALTTGELRRRLESQGVDRWQARLVGGLLEECDAVIYAGYRPAMERREADLTMAREIVEVA